MSVIIDGSNGITTPLDVEIQGSTSGSIVIAAPAVAGSNTQTLVAATGTLAPLIAGTAVASTSGTSIDFTSIPSWVKRVTVMFAGVSASGSSNYQIQIGTSGGIQSTSYLVNSSQITGAAAASATANSGFKFGSAAYNVGTDVFNGLCQLCLLDSSSGTWAAFGCIGNSASSQSHFTAGSKSLSGTLDRVRITTVNGTDTFDAGSINILYE